MCFVVVIRVGVRVCLDFLELVNEIEGGVKFS